MSRLLLAARWARGHAPHLALFLLVLVFVGWPIFFAGCVPPALPAHYAGLTANRALPVLVQLEEREGDLVIAEHAGDPDAIDEGLARVEARWAPFWDAWNAFITAQHAWADAFEAHNDQAKIDAAETTAVAAFCAVRKALPEKVPPELLAVAAVACAP